MERPELVKKIHEAFKLHPIVALLGPRQSGKTTIAKQYSKKFKQVDFFDLENPLDLARLQNPIQALDHATSQSLIVIDEIQRLPELFPYLRSYIDVHQRKRKILILGSASRDLIQQSSETLAGRISYLEISPFLINETGLEHFNRLWIRGGFPLSYLASSEKMSLSWRNEYISTYLERDIPQLGFQIPANQMRRLWQMLTHYHGQIFNASELGKSLQLTHPTVRKYLDILVGTFMIRELRPWYENISKRQVKSPKIYFRDSGLFHALLTIENKKQLTTHPKLGASWEGFVLEQLIQTHRLQDCYFWSVHSQAELDLLVMKGGKKIGFEIKYQDAPTLTKSMKAAIELLKLNKLFIIYPGNVDYTLEKNVFVLSVKNLTTGSHVPF